VCQWLSITSASDNHDQLDSETYVESQLLSAAKWKETVQKLQVEEQRLK